MEYDDIPKTHLDNLKAEVAKLSAAHGSSIEDAFKAVGACMHSLLLYCKLTDIDAKFALLNHMKPPLGKVTKL